MGILEDFAKRAQELRNEVPTAETDTPSQESTDDPTNNLEFVDRSDQKKNRTHGPHGESTNKTAQSDMPDRMEHVRQRAIELLRNPETEEQKQERWAFEADLSVDELMEYDNVRKQEIRQLLTTIEWSGNESADGRFKIEPSYRGGTTVSGYNLIDNGKRRGTYDTVRDAKFAAEDYVQKSALKNPFHVAQVKETGHDDGELHDQQTAETGHIGGGEPAMRYDQGGRSLGKSEDPSKHVPSHHDRENNAEKEQIV